MVDLNYEKFEKLRKYYNENCKPLIFSGERKLSTNNCCKMYFLDVTEEQELKNYKKVFQEYLALYVRSYDKLKYYKEIDENSTDDEILQYLVKYSSDIWNNTTLITTSTPETLGIYGEALNDFYINIVKNENILITYSSKRAYSERNVRGIDVLGTTWKNGNLTLIFSECKFVNSISKASIELSNDIKGTEEEIGHVNKDYINSYITFVVNKSHSIFAEIDNQEKIMSVLDELNDKVINGVKAIDAFNELNINIRFTFFAVYHDNKFTPDERQNMFEKVTDAFAENILYTGIKKYEIEVVFIPIKNNSSLIKEHMRQWS